MVLVSLEEFFGTRAAPSNSEPAAESTTYHANRRVYMAAPRNLMWLLVVVSPAQSVLGVCRVELSGEA